MRDKEDILVFTRGAYTYVPQMVQGAPYKARGGKRNDETYGQYTEQRSNNHGVRYPKQVLEFPIVERDKYHPSQKPVELMAYLIRTYSRPNDRVLDNAMGSGTTGVACVQESRKFVGIEIDADFFRSAITRIKTADAIRQARLSDI